MIFMVVSNLLLKWGSFSVIKVAVILRPILSFNHIFYYDLPCPEISLFRFSIGQQSGSRSDTRKPKQQQYTVVISPPTNLSAKVCLPCIKLAIWKKM